MIKEKLSCQFSHEIAEFVKAAACYYPLALALHYPLRFLQRLSSFFSKDDIWPTNQTLLIRTSRAGMTKNLGFFKNTKSLFISKIVKYVA